LGWGGGPGNEVRCVGGSAIAEFIRDLNPRDDVFLFAFSDQPFLLQSFTTNHSVVISRLALLHAYGRTALYYVILEGLIMVARGRYDKNAPLIVTDGMDNSSSLCAIGEGMKAPGKGGWDDLKPFVRTRRVRSPARKPDGASDEGSVIVRPRPACPGAIAAHTRFGGSVLDPSATAALLPNDLVEPMASSVAVFNAFGDPARC
jgi:hypothetical protein